MAPRAPTSASRSRPNGRARKRGRTVAPRGTDSKVDPLWAGNHASIAGSSCSISTSNSKPGWRMNKGPGMGRSFRGAPVRHRTGVSRLPRGREQFHTLRQARPLPTLSALYVGWRLSQLGQSSRMFSGRLFCQIPSVWSAIRQRFPVVMLRSPHPHSSHRGPLWSISQFFKGVAKRPMDVRPLTVPSIQPWMNSARFKSARQALPQ